MAIFITINLTKRKMKRNLFFLIATAFTTLAVNGQNLFFIGENSYPCTESFDLKSNLEDGEDLNVLFAKDEATPIIAVTTQSSKQGTKISGKLIIYLDDGKIITCIDRGESYYVDDTAKAVYSLSNDQVNKMKNSNINTVRYTLNIYGIKEVNRSASNKGISTKDLINKFFNNDDRINEVTVKNDKEPNKKRFDALMGGLNNKQGQLNGDPYATSYYGSPGSGSGKGGYGLNGRSLANQGNVTQECNEEGRVVVKIIVDRNGKVIDATPGVKGTTNNHPCLLESARKTAFLHSWNSDFKAPSQQVGFVVVNFKLGE